MKECASTDFSFTFIVTAIIYVYLMLTKYMYKYIFLILYSLISSCWCVTFTLSSLLTFPPSLIEVLCVITVLVCSKKKKYREFQIWRSRYTCYYRIKLSTALISYKGVTFFFFNSVPIVLTLSFLHFFFFFLRKFP
jgi:hypothetical protein